MLGVVDEWAEFLEGGRQLIGDVTPDVVGGSRWAG